MRTGWRLRQARGRAAIEEHRSANQSYIEDGVLLLELASSAGRLFREQPATEKRRLLDLLLLNSSWKDGQLHAEFRQPFDMLAVAAAPVPLGAGSKGADPARSEKWWTILDLNQ